MSQFNIGQATIDLKLRAEKAEEELARVRGELDKLKKKGESAASSTGDGFVTQASRLRSFATRVVAIGVTLTGLFSLGQKLRQVYDDFFKSGTEKAKEFKDALDSIDPETVVKATQEQRKFLAGALSNLLGEKTGIEGAIRAFLVRISVGSADQIKQELKNLELSETQALQQIEKRRQDAGKDRVESEKRKLRDLRDAQLDGIDAVNAKEKAAIQDLDEREKKLNVVRDKYDAQIAALIEEEKVQVRINAEIQRRSELIQQQNDQLERFHFADITVGASGRGGEQQLAALLFRTGGR